MTKEQTNIHQQQQKKHGMCVEVVNIRFKFLQDFLPDSAICASLETQEKKNVRESNATCFFFVFFL
jgi:hypothetical protein